MPDRDRAIARARILLEAHGVKQAPVDVFDLASKEGIQVSPQLLDDSISGLLVRRENASLIGINSDHHPNRQRFTLAHELGHYVLHANHMPTVFVDNVPVYFRGLTALAEPTPEEVEANVFAAELLMPSAFLNTELRGQAIDANNDSAVKQLARRYGVSVQALTIRLTELGLVSGIVKRT